MERDTLAQHLAAEHQQSTFAAYIKEIVYGGIDGIVTTFAVVAGFAGAAIAHEQTVQLSLIVVLLFGLANLFADGVSMGLGNFLSVRSNKQLFARERAKEQREIQKNPASEAEETVLILMDKGFSESDAKALTEIYRHNEQYWTDWMMANELEMQDPSGDNPIYTGLATFASFVAFGFIPLIPFVMSSTNVSAQMIFFYSCVGSLIALFLLGIMKWKVVRGSVYRSVLEVMVVGSVAGIVAFLVGSLFTL